MNKNYKIISAVIAIIAVFAIASIVYKKQQSTKLGMQANENYKLFVPDHAPAMGPEDAPVTIVEFLDPECESCRAFYPYVKDVMEKYKGQVRLVVRYAAFHKNSTYAISILEATRKQNLYWETLGVLFKSQPAWGNHHNPRPDLIWSYLPTVKGLDIEKVKTDMHDPSFIEIVKKDMEDGKNLGVRGTPTFYINGQPLKSFNYGQLELQVREELEK